MRRIPATSTSTCRSGGTRPRTRTSHWTVRRTRRKWISALDPTDCDEPPAWFARGVYNPVFSFCFLDSSLFFFVLFLIFLKNLCGLENSCVNNCDMYRIII